LVSILFWEFSEKILVCKFTKKNHGPINSLFHFEPGSVERWFESDLKHILKSEKTLILLAFKYFLIYLGSLSLIGLNCVTPIQKNNH